ncbi:MAG: 4-hydroxy-3-methylbut-2-enyl diphosphate reductase, partial [Clostridia bacterium]|nr:4-hydroxy-3-methylbut-2-enyl diphosphate reductase [Clostridia bacterium]
MQRITLAKTAGFCFGVGRAVGIAYKAAENNSLCCSLGPVIHNTDVTDDLAAKGVRIVNSLDEIRAGETVIIRAHGIAPDVLETIVKSGADICDATCPFVQKIHDIVSQNSADNISVLIAGNPEHPEVVGIRGCCKGESFVFSSAEDVERILKNNENLQNNDLVVVSQTTFSEEEWKKSEKIIKFYCTNCKIFDTICIATRKRQEEAAELSLKCDAMVVIGGRHSSNTAKLKEVCSGNCDTFLVERADELHPIDVST